jgi:fructose-1,6-bisphosphatase/inositol monophosphatase family enzyme
MTLKNQMEEFISFANIMADESAKVIMEYFRQTFAIENKDDDTPVTIADKKSELKIRELINKAYPSHGILAEEFDNTNLDSEYIWVIDPIDGTRSFIAGHKDFGTLIALLYKKKTYIRNNQLSCS